MGAKNKKIREAVSIKELGPKNLGGGQLDDDVIIGAKSTPPSSPGAKVKIG